MAPLRSTETVGRDLVADALLDRRVRLAPNVVYRTFALETVVVNLDRGVYHGLNPTAGLMLEALERSPSVREACARLTVELEQPLEVIEADMVRFCGDLLERGLIELDR